MRELWDVQELTQKWGLKPSWVYQHIHELPHYKLGNHVRFDPKELQQFLAERARRGPKTTTRNRD